MVRTELTPYNPHCGVEGHTGAWFPSRIQTSDLWRGWVTR